MNGEVDSKKCKHVRTVTCHLVGEKYTYLFGRAMNQLNVKTVILNIEY